MCNLYRLFLPCLPHIVRPLIESLAKTKREFTVTKDMLQSVSAMKNLLSNACMLIHPIRSTKLLITIDASNMAQGGVLHQHHHGSLQPLAFFSRKLNDAEINYSTINRELLAVAAAVKHFQHSIKNGKIGKK